MICSLCPRKCGAKRTETENKCGYCKMPLNPVVARSALHFWEEPCISGKNGSGTVFFSGCSLSCVFCQNREISHENKGKMITVERLAEIFKELEQKGAENINLVNPTHYMLAIKKALEIYKPNIPIVFNSSGYESETAIKSALEFADVFLLDLKYINPQKALKYSGAADYPYVAKKAIKTVGEHIKENTFSENNIMTKGLIVRHLCLPHNLYEAKRVIEFVEQNVPNAALSLMSQYVPCGNLDDYPEINRKLSILEHKKLLLFAVNSNIETVYCQQLTSGSEDFIPLFDFSGV